MFGKIFKTKTKKSRDNLPKRLRVRAQNFLARRPHRSFRRTRRRDYRRSLTLPGYWSFTVQSAKQLWNYKKVFLSLVALYFVLSVIFVGLGSQETYSQLSGAIETTGGDLVQGFFGKIGAAGLLLLASTGGALEAPGASDAQKLFGVILFLMIWLTTVWLLRAQLAGGRPKLRDALYSAGSPIVATFLIVLLIVIQLLPIAIAMVGFAALSGYGLLDGGGLSMLFWVVATLLSILSLYWLTSTVMAMVIVTLPGMYPLQAVRTAGDLVVGRRVRILLRLAWLLGTVIVTWALVMIPIILLDGWVKSLAPAIEAWPFVPVIMLLLGALTIIWATTYIYMLYRKVVDDDAAPA